MDAAKDASNDPTHNHIPHGTQSFSSIPSSSASAPSHSSSSTTHTTHHNHLSNSAAPVIGVEHWEQRRRQWTQSHRPYDPDGKAGESFRNHAALKEVEPVHYDAIYQSLVAGRRFAKPVPLDFITTILIHGWKKEGLWPTDDGKPPG
ncbi:hypothetical protein HDU67_009381 [Dinochytrium kinnereticum]|nr:hypothetical protein HDU67_009381 [Dinochytrium kinnereticum]